MPVAIAGAATAAAITGVTTDTLVHFAAFGPADWRGFLRLDQSYIGRMAKGWTFQFLDHPRHSGMSRPVPGQ